jgi:hypothetical protein
LGFEEAKTGKITDKRKNGKRKITPQLARTIACTEKESQGSKAGAGLRF